VQSGLRQNAGTYFPNQLIDMTAFLIIHVIALIVLFVWEKVMKLRFKS